MTDQLDLIDPHGLAELAEAVLGEVDRANTERAFAGDWRLWLAFCETAQRAGHADALPLTVSATNLVLFAKWLAQGGAMPDGRIRKPAAPESPTHRGARRLARARAGLPARDHHERRRWVDDYHAKLIEHRQLTGRGKAAALTITDIRKIVTSISADTNPR